MDTRAADILLAIETAGVELTPSPRGEPQAEAGGGRAVAGLEVEEFGGQREEVAAYGDVTAEVLVQHAVTEPD